MHFLCPSSMPFETVDSGFTGGGWGWGGGYYRDYGNGPCRGICNCFFFLGALYVGGFVLVVFGVLNLNAAVVDEAGKNIQAFNSYVSTWSGLSSTFGAAVPVLSTWVGSKPGDSLGDLKLQEKSYPSTYFGTKTDEWTSNFFFTRASVNNTTLSSDGTSTIVLETQGSKSWGPYKVALLKDSSWTCNDRTNAAKGKLCTAPTVGADCGLDFGSDGCPPSGRHWQYSIPQWEKSPSGQCKNNNNCYCQCGSSSRSRGRIYDKYTNYMHSCSLDAYRYCGAGSSYKQVCYVQAPNYNTCKKTCEVSNKGLWDTVSGTCRLKQALTSMCAAVESANPLSAAVNPDKADAGCDWDPVTKSFTLGQYKVIPEDSIEKVTQFEVQVMSKKDPYYLGTKMTNGCALMSTSPPNCFGTPRGTLLTIGFSMVIIGGLIIVCPCITYKCFKSSKTPAPNTNYQQIASAPVVAGANQTTTAFAPGVVHGVYAQQQPFQGGYPQYPQHTFQGNPQQINGQQNFHIQPTAPPIAHAVPAQHQQPGAIY